MHADNIYTDKHRRQSTTKTLPKLNGTIKQIYTHKRDIIFPGDGGKKKKQTNNTFLSIIWAKIWLNRDIQQQDTYKFGKIDALLGKCIISQHTLCVPPFEGTSPNSCCKIYGTY